MSAYSDLVQGHANLQVYYRMNESSGATTLVDAEGVQNGTIVTTGTTYEVTGALVNDTNKALTFDGSGNAANVPDNAALDLTDGPFSIEFWVKRSATQSAAQTLLNKGTTGGTGYHIRFDAANSVVFRGSTNIVSYGPITDQNWHHVVWTKNGSANKLYFDGVEPSGLSYSNQTLGDTTNVLRIAHQTAAGAERFPGSMDELAIYKAVLSAAEVLEHYRIGRGLIGEATETDTAQALDKDKAATLTAATESDTAQALVYSKPIVKSITPATETDVAQAFDFDKQVTLTSAGETDAAQTLSVTRNIYKTLTPVTETDEAQALQIAVPPSGGGGWKPSRRRLREAPPHLVFTFPAYELDLAQPLEFHKASSVAPITDNTTELEDLELLLLA